MIYFQNIEKGNVCINTLWVKRMEKLVQMLLRIGGKEVLVPETIPEEITQLGHIYDYKVLTPVGGTSRYYLSNEEDIQVVWGFVLDEEGVWKMHSWLVHKEKPVIIDNEEYVKYFGFKKQQEQE